MPEWGDSDVERRAADQTIVEGEPSAHSAPGQHPRELPDDSANLGLTYSSGSQLRWSKSALASLRSAVSKPSVKRS